MANKEVPLLYNEYRLNALERALEENGSSVEMALKNTLDSLYRRFVPHAERAEIRRFSFAQRRRGYYIFVKIR